MRAASVLTLLLLAAPACAGDRRPVWGVRGGYLSPSSATQKYLGTGLPMLEGFGDFRLGEKSDLEIAVSGWVGRGLEEGTAMDGTRVSGYQFRQTLTVIPVLATLGTGTYKENYDIRLGAGLGVYTARIDRSMVFADPVLQAYYGQTSTKTTATVGPHLQIAGEYFLNRNRTIAVSLFMRYAYAQVNESFSRFFRSGTGDHLNFAESDRAGNVAGFMAGYGLSWRF